MSGSPPSPEQAHPVQDTAARILVAEEAASVARRRGLPRAGVAGALGLLAMLAFWLAGNRGGAARGVEELAERGWVAWERGDQSAAESEWEEAERFAPDSAHTQLLRGMILLGGGKSALALEPLRDAARQPATRSRALVLAARAYLAARSLGGAEEVLRAAVAEYPDDVSIRRLAGAVYYDLGVNSQAIPHLEAVGRLDLRDARPFRLIGLMRKDFQDYPAAIAAYEEVLRRAAPDSPLLAETRLELAQCLKEVRRYEEALAVLPAADRSDEAQAVRLAAFTSLGRMDEARAIVSAIPDNATATAALCLEAAGFAAASANTPEEISWLERTVRADPVDFVPRYRLAGALARVGRVAEADEQRAASERQRALHEQLHALQMEAMNAPRDANLRCELGKAALALGRKELAKVWFQAALGLDPANQDAARELGKLSSD